MNKDKKRTVPQEKIEKVKTLINNIKKFRTVLIASCKGLPSAQFHDIRKKLREIAEIMMVKKNIAKRAIDDSEKSELIKLKNLLTSDIAFFFSNKDAFTLSSILEENKIPSRAKAGDVAPEDIEIQPGPTDLPPGPAISELSSVGLKIAVKEGRLEIIKGTIVAKKGELIKGNVASVLGKLGISPMKVGFVPIAAYDSIDNTLYKDIRIDKEKTLNEMRELIKKAIWFSINISYPIKENIKYFLTKAYSEEKILDKIYKSKLENIREEG